MNVCPKTDKIYADRLIKKWHCPCHGVRTQRLRLGRNLPIYTRKVQELYASTSVVKAVRFLMDTLPNTIGPAYREFNRLRYGEQIVPDSRKKWIPINR